jgi:hypothetical protein
VSSQNARHKRLGEAREEPVPPVMMTLKLESAGGDGVMGWSGCRAVTGASPRLRQSRMVARKITAGAYSVPVGDGREDCPAPDLHPLRPQNKPAGRCDSLCKAWIQNL